MLQAFFLRISAHHADGGIVCDIDSMHPAFTESEPEKIGWAEDPGLANWVIRQRRCKKNMNRGKPNERMPARRGAKLEMLGFACELSAATLGKRRSDRANLLVAQ